MSIDAALSKSALFIVALFTVALFNVALWHYVNVGLFYVVLLMVDYVNVALLTGLLF